jgi:outer membrane protein
MHKTTSNTTSNKSSSSKQRLMLICLLTGTITAPLNSVMAQSSNTLSLANTLQALSEGSDWQNVVLNLQIAEQNRSAAAAALGLNLTASSDYSLSQPVSTSNSTTAPNSYSLTVSATASLNVLPWSSGYDNLRNSERNLLRAQWDARDGYNNLVLTTTQQYWNGYLAILDLEINQKTLNLRQKQLKNAQTQQQNNQITRESLLASEQSLANTQANLLGAENTLQNTLLALGLAQTPVLVSQPKGIASKESLGDLLTIGLKNRSDLQKAALKLLEAQDNLDNAQRDRWLPSSSISIGLVQGQNGPAVRGSLNVQSGVASLSGSYPLVSSSNSTGAGASTNTSTNFTLSASFGLPLLSPSGDSKVKNAELALQSARLAQQSTISSATLDITSKYNDQQLSLERLNISQLALQNSQSSLETAKAKSKVGLNTALDLESAELNRLQSQRDLESALINQINATLKLKIAIGSPDLKPFLVF